MSSKKGIKVLGSLFIGISDNMLYAHKESFDQTRLMCMHKYVPRIASLKKLRELWRNNRLNLK